MSLLKDSLYRRLIKPALDASLSLFFIVILTPLMVSLSAVILAVDGRPILFRQIRVGQNKKKFTIYKFRTMKDSKGPLLTFDNDPRVTKLGRVLRRYKLDELPQLFNILKGEMSFIGPRPEVSILADQRYRISNEVFSFKPGITGLSSINFIDEYKILPKQGKQIYKAYLDRILPKKIGLDYDYAQKISFSLDLKIFLKTAGIIFRTIFYG